MLGGAALGICATLCNFTAEMIGGGWGSQVVGLLGLVLTTFGYYVGPGTVGVVLIGELNPQYSRPLVSSLALSVNWIPSACVLLGYPPLHLAIGPYAILPLTVAGVLSLVFLAIYMPETKGKTVSEVINRWTPDPKVLDNVVNDPTKRF